VFLFVFVEHSPVSLHLSLISCMYSDYPLVCIEHRLEYLHRNVGDESDIEHMPGWREWRSAQLTAGEWTVWPLVIEEIMFRV
jgi:hypothetical protein